MQRKTNHLLGIATLAAIALSAGSAQAGSYLPVTGTGFGAAFPTVGADIGPEIIITIADGVNPGSFTATVTSTGQPTFDGHDDSYIGVINNSSSPVTSMHLTGKADGEGEGPFDFDGDGLEQGINNSPLGAVTTALTAYYGHVPDDIGIDWSNHLHGLDSPVPGDVSYNYAGPGTNFANWSNTEPKLTADVLFTDVGGLPTGFAAYFSVETDLTAAGVPDVGQINQLPEPASLSMLAVGAAGLLIRRRKA